MSHALDERLQPHLSCIDMDIIAPSSGDCPCILFRSAPNYCDFVLNQKSAAVTQDEKRTTVYCWIYSGRRYMYKKRKNIPHNLMETSVV